MKKLEPKKLMPYLPYYLKVIMEGKKCNVAWMSTKHITIIRPQGIGEVKKIKWEYAHLNIKPILRPLSDLTKDIEHNGKKFAPCNGLFITGDFDELIGKDSVSYANDFINSSDRLDMCYDFNFWIKLFEWHFDVFGLIDEGLAIDINTLE